MATEPFIPPVCDNCHHAYAEHTGRHLGWQTYERRSDYTAVQWEAAVGPPNRNRWGSSCSFRTDWHHTCACSEWMVSRDGERITQRMLERGEAEPLLLT